MKTKIPEFSYPISEGNVYTTYGGSGGVRLDSLFKKTLFSVKFKTEKISAQTFSDTGIHVRCISYDRSKGFLQ